MGSHCVNFYGYRLVINSVVTLQGNIGDFYCRDVGGDYSDDETDNTVDEEAEEQQAGSKEKKLSGKKESPGKAGDNKTQVKESSEEKKKSPARELGPRVPFAELKHCRRDRYVLCGGIHGHRHCRPTASKCWPVW